jgi:GTP cyclohydrolase IB
MHVTVPATSLCPCSKEISAYGAHNQRSHISIEAELEGDVAVEELIAIAEGCASCEVYGLLKRADEKYVTERAYDSPRFVEDLVRDVALVLNGDQRVGAYVVEAENARSPVLSMPRGIGPPLNGSISLTAPHLISERGSASNAQVPYPSNG